MEYAERLSWDVAGRSIRKVIEEAAAMAGARVPPCDADSNTGL
jgi:hypothetical protein